MKTRKEEASGLDLSLYDHMEEAHANGYVSSKFGETVREKVEKIRNCACHYCYMPKGECECEWSSNAT